MSGFTINRVVLVGRLTRDPELRALPDGTSVCALRLACNELRRDRDGGLAERPNYFDVHAYGASAEACARYLRTGAQVGVDGRLQWREWDARGALARRQAVAIVADCVQFLDPAGGGRSCEADTD
ncbi:MAG TPA: single-stranded DNA-binding protein [Solirubrobacteraceae bacterium]|nr:single-stranded DNA-binding protein [Solirubrobacteraceae bacterium]